MRLVRADIDRYGPLYDCRPECGNGITVIAGPNEAGKTLYLEALLRLIEPSVTDVMRPGPRVDQEPTGRVLIEYADETVECDGGDTFSSITGIEPSHLESVFVVRDNDLRLPEERGYYTSLIEKLGDIHTSEIEMIKSALAENGRLTPADRRLASNDRHDYPKDVRDEAKDLIEAVRSYKTVVEEDSLDELSARRLRLTRRLHRKREELDACRDAIRLREYRRLTDQLEAYRKASERLAELEGFDRETLEALREASTDRSRNREELETLQRRIDEKEAELDGLRGDIESQEERLAEFDRRQAAVDIARSTLETYREYTGERNGASRRLSVAKPGAIVSLAAAGFTGGVGAVVGSEFAIGLGFALLIAAVVFGWVYRRANSTLSAVEATRESAIAAARDGGFDVESIEQIAPAIEAFDRTLEQLRERHTRTDESIQQTETRLDELQSRTAAIEKAIDTKTDEIETTLEAAGVDLIDAFAERVERREELVPERQSARQSLIDQFGEVDGDGYEEQITEWQDELEAFIAGVDRLEVDPDRFDEDDRSALSDAVESIETELESLERQLDEHDDRLDDLDRQAREINATPFIGRNLSLDAKNAAGLEALAQDVETLVERIETDADISRKALELFDRIERNEEEKLTDLFDSDGPASTTFARLTDDRYTEVTYDTDDHDLTVTRRDGRVFDVERLSQGTKDQLYFSSRVSLGKQLIGNEPGFFLLDDPFLAADADRLHAGFQTLETLAEAGWQILYLTAKREVSVTMVEDFGLDRIDIDPIPVRADSSD